MPYNDHLANRVREQQLSVRKVEEKMMMGGLTFMVNSKMCLGILNDELMARIDPEVYESALEKRGCRPIDFTGRPMKGFVFISPEGTITKKELEYQIKLSLEFNKKAKASKKKK